MPDRRAWCPPRSAPGMNQWFIPVNNISIDSRLWHLEEFIPYLESVSQDGEIGALFFLR
jgi:hypothetical protein